MKELSIEQKAKAYDEAKLRMSAAYNSNRCTIGFMNEIFPELKESEDEKMIKSINRLIRYYHDVNFPTPEGFSRKDLLDWIEKQGNANKEYWRGYREGKQEILDKYAELEKQGEQKPVDKVEPKFKVGDIITNGKIIGKVDENENNKYHGWFGYDKDLSVHYADIPDVENWHKWTIQDAKDGDILSYRKGQWVFIFKEIENNNSIIEYYVLSSEIGLEIKNIASPLISAILPATKEQRDLLFQKMKESGYEWDTDKKELKKIEQKPTIIIPKFKVGDIIRHKEQGCTCKITAIDTATAEYGVSECSGTHLPFDFQDAWELVEQNSTEWTEEDDRILYNVIAYVGFATGQKEVREDTLKETNSWLKNIKERVQPQPKQEWSKEDEQLYNDLSDTYFYNDEDYPEETYKLMLKRVLNWMTKRAKFLRPQNWTKEDKERYESCLQRLSTGNPEQPETINSKWFKEHVYPKPQSTWRPSDRQMNVLEHYMHTLSCNEYKEILFGLYTDLKKLREE